MPRFNQDVDIDIDPSEYLDYCSNEELQEIYDILKEEYGPIIDDKSKIIRSESHRKFLKNLDVLEDAWDSVSKEDAEIISVIAKKYGAV